MIILLKTFAVFTILCQARSEVVSKGFDVIKVTQRTYGSQLSSFNSSGIIQCAAECQKNDACESLLYDPVTQLCTTNSLAVLPTSLMTSSDGQEYDYTAKVIPTTTTSTTSTTSTSTSTTSTTSTTTTTTTTTTPPPSQATNNNQISCTSNTQCTASKSECRDGVCKCYYGHSYDASKDSCVTSCARYGTTFQEEINLYLNGYNTETHYDISRTQCETLCIQETTFTCRTYEFDINSNNCFLQTDTAHTVSYSTSTSYRLYTRDCA